MKWKSRLRTSESQARPVRDSRHSVGKIHLMLVIHWRSRCRAGPQPQTRLSLSSKTYLHSYRLHNGDSWPRRLNRQATKFSLGPLMRSEEHTSELQSLMRSSYAVFCLKQKIA